MNVAVYYSLLFPGWHDWESSSRPTARRLGRRYSQVEECGRVAVDCQAQVYAGKHRLLSIFWICIQNDDRSFCSTYTLNFHSVVFVPHAYSHFVVTGIFYVNLAIFYLSTYTLPYANLRRQDRLLSCLWLFVFGTKIISHFCRGTGANAAASYISYFVFL